MSALHRFVGPSRAGVFALLSGISSAFAQTEAPVAPEPGSPAAPVAPAAPETPPGPAAEEPVAPATPEPEAAAPELTPQPEPAPVAEPLAPAQPAPVVGEPTPAVATAAPVGVDDGASINGDGERKRPRQFGAMFDLGVPDGTTLSFVYRPIDLARVHAGVSYNGVSPGLRLGGEFLPLGWGPSIGLVYGHYFEGDANGIAGMFGTIDDDTAKLLENIGYDYFTIRAGMEFGGDRFTFFARGGVSWLRTTIHELDSIIVPDAGSNMTVEVKEDPVLNAFTPTIQLGMIVQI